MSLGWKLAWQVAAGFLVLACAFFALAGTVRYWQGWAFLGVWTIPAIFFLTYFYKHDPALLQRRMQKKEKVKEQKVIMKAIYAVIYAGFVLPGLDFRFGWTKRWIGAVPPWLEIVSLCLIEAGYLFVTWVFYVNRYAARTIQVEEGQPVITAGPYKWVRHPMYLGSVVMFLFTPVALGSYLALPVFALTVPIYIMRLLNEEKVLRSELTGYSDYCDQTRHRLLPYIW